MMYRTPTQSHPLVYTNDTAAHAIDLATGMTAWTFQAASPIVRMALGHEQLYLLDQDSVLYIITIDGGMLRAKVETASRSAWGAALIALDDRVIVATTDNVVAVTPEGQTVWRWANPSPGAGRVLPGLALPGHIVQPDLKD